MGCVNSTPTVRNPHHPHVYKYLQIMRLDHPLNVNKKYEHICKIIPDVYVGSGLRKTCAYECLTTENDFLLKRAQYWETRTSGSKELWNVIDQCLKLPTDGDILVQLQNYGLIALNNSMQMCVDSNFSKYDVPVFCINMPTQFAAQLPALKNLKPTFKEDTLNIKVRSQKFPIDVPLTFVNTILVEDVKKMYLDEVKLDPSQFRLRLFFKGQQMLQGYQIGRFDLLNNFVIQAMITKCD